MLLFSLLCPCNSKSQSTSDVLQRRKREGRGGSKNCAQPSEELLVSCDLKMRARNVITWLHEDLSEVIPGRHCGRYRGRAGLWL